MNTVTVVAAGYNRIAGNVNDAQWYGGVARRWQSMR